MDFLRRSPVFACALLLALLLAPAAARAQADPVTKVTSLNKKALEAYAKRDFETARTLLKQALDLCNTAGLDSHPIKARTHIHFGVVTIVGFKQRDLGIKHFRKALEIQSDIKLTKSLVTPELQDAFEEAMMGAGGGEGGQAPPAPTAQDEGGAAAPSEGGGPAAAPAGEDDQGARRPARAQRVKKKKRPSGDEEDDQGGGADDEDDEDGPSYKLYIAVAFGSGFGVASGSGELNPAHKLQSAGFAPAQLGFISPEIGFFLNPRFLLSARLRLQYVSGLVGQRPPSGSGCGSDNFCSPGTTAFAGFVRGTFFLGAKTLRPFLGAEIGGGNIRHAQVFPSDKTCGTMANTTCVDTLASGPLFLGGVVGILIDAGSAVGFVASLAIDAGVPKFTANFDVDAGLVLHF